ncbi:MAG: hypothetical protein NZM43_00715 [Saprospiraceae bacterium]|nr:hypothetical protein [Saprospiraceae bacterium]MDW8482824.1 hypothetical protein [Saprospiraceae bacterium]
MCVLYWKSTLWTGLLLTLLTGKAFFSAAQEEAKVRMDFGTGAVEIGDSLVLHLKIEQANVSPVFTDLSKWSLALRENLLHQTPWKHQDSMWCQALALIFFEEGKIEIPPVGVVLSSGDTLWSGPIYLGVLAPQVPTFETNWRDIKPLWSVFPISERQWGGWGIVGLGLVLVFASIIVYLLFRRSRVLSKEEGKTPYERAMEQLADLERQSPWLKGGIKAYYTELSRIVREYLEHQYGFPALESSSEDILRYAQAAAFPNALLLALREWLNWCDLVKFARVVPPEHHHLRALSEARRLIEQTAPNYFTTESTSSSVRSQLFL